MYCNNLQSFMNGRNTSISKRRHIEIHYIHISVINVEVIPNAFARKLVRTTKNKYNKGICKNYQLIFADFLVNFHQEKSEITL